MCFSEIFRLRQSQSYQEKTQKKTAAVGEGEKGRTVF